jgi:phospholipase/carboxylesterase
VDEREIDATIALVPLLLRALETLGFVSRHLHPPEFQRLAPVVEAADQALRAVAATTSPTSNDASPVRALLDSATNETLSAFDELCSAFADGDLRQVYRALRHVPRAQEALYPLTAMPPISRFFLEPSVRDDTDLTSRLANAAPSDTTGVHHFSNDPGTRGGFSLYIPEYYTPDTAWPLIVALHGGAGHGRGFLWSWLRDARSHGAILISPTAIGDTWALQGPDVDTPNLLRMVEHVSANWNIDKKHMLLTGMSDGGTFSYVSGLESDSPFTHLAPISAAFHPMLVAMADRDRLRGLPIRITHGALDWMFSIEMAREAERYLSDAGANTTLVELDDLSHTYPREENAAIIKWLKGNDASS